ncbi:LADA_0B10814g1_1 [Lachancea dasiensis]|uniref:Phosphoinositide phospholipase C n=1 Tax=Lachancea dasiensis TaxID=1072105 RepID=A0A1G4IVF0_9SACH|nr:LADA_0B10814g1_1 [Lachancea dasiensis]
MYASKLQNGLETPKFAAPQLWLKRSQTEGLLVLDRSSPRFDSGKVNENQFEDAPRQNFRRIIQKTANLISRPKPRKSSTYLGPITQNQEFPSSRVQCRQHTRPSDDKTLRAIYIRLENGLNFTKVTRKKQIEYKFFVSSGVLRWMDSKSIELDAIKDIRSGEMAKNYIDDYNVSDSEARNWLTIIYQTGTKYRALHLVSHSSDDFECFYTGIVSIVKSRHNLIRSVSNPDDDMFANVHWRATVSAEKQADDIDVLSFQDVEDLCAKFNIFCSSGHLRKLFNIADTNRNGLLNYTEFQSFVQELKRRPEMVTIWSKISKGSDKLQFDDFVKFLEVEQGEPDAREKALAEYSRLADGNQVMNINAFQKYLTSQPYLKESVTDYSLPINKYFISSSHNTYLQGKQLGEAPTVETYVHALQQGCRCIEIDIWDSEEGPVVCHGKLTSSLPLKNVIKVVRKYAFITSPFPLVLSLEVHCNLANQVLIETIIKKELGDKIYIEPQQGALPSPASLKHRFLIKVKKSKKEDHKSPFDEELLSSSSTSSSYDSEFEIGRLRGRRLSIAKKVHVVENLVTMSLIHGLKFRNFSLPESKSLNHCFSLNEKKLEHMIKDETQRLAVEKHNRRFLMRVYPHALRYKSSNFNPIKFWELGVQMVATNWQTYDLGQQLNKAMFHLPLEAGSLWHSGYVLKPEFLLEEVNKAIDIRALHAGLRKRKRVLQLDIISAQMLPRPKDLKPKVSSYNFSVKLNIHGCGKPTRPLESINGVAVTDTSGSTHICKENGFSPVWETKFRITLEDSFFNFLLLTVRAGESDLATCCLKLSYLRRGYRHIPLYSESGDRYIFSTLFMGINYDYI